MQCLGMRQRRAFTLIELLLVIGIIAILASIVIVAINPMEMVRASRDAQRSSELNGIAKAIRVVEIQGAFGSLTSANVVAVSLPDTSSTCANLGLPPLPAGWTYRCATAANLTKSDGTGWIPVNFDLVPAAGIGNLAIDPTNTLANGYYYTYVYNGGVKLTAVMESRKYLDAMKGDGGPDNTLYETGPKLDLANFARGLAGYWKLDDGTGTAPADSSGNGYTATFVGTPTWTTSGKINGAMAFNRTSLYTTTIVSGSGPSTMAAWVSPGDDTSSWKDVFGESCSGPWLSINAATLYYGLNCGSNYSATTTTMAANTWAHLVLVWDGTSTMSLYKDGVLIASRSNSVTHAVFNIANYASSSNGEQYIGSMDDVRYYNRALSANEVLALYNATR